MAARCPQVPFVPGDDGCRARAGANDRLSSKTRGPVSWLVSHPSSSTDAQGNTLTYAYDASGNQTSTTDQLSSQNQFSATYNPNGTVASTTDARGSVTSYGYDAHGNLTSITPPAPLGAITIVPDSLSRVHSRTDGKGQTTTYAYDSLDRVTGTTYQDGTSLAYGYDANGNRVSMADATGSTSWAYDAQNRQTSKSSPQAGSFSYGYDPVSNLTSLVGAAGTTSYTYNNVNELTALKDFDGTTTTFGYDPNHHRATTSYPNGVVMTTSYDSSQRIASIVSAKGGTNLTNLAYSYTNPATNKDTMLQYSETDAANGRVSAMTYDVVNRLTEFKISGSYTKDYQYSYDGNGNRVQQYEDGVGTSYAYNSANEITNAGTLTYTFDANGNELTNSGGLSYAYNAQNQTTNLSSTQPANNLPMTYTGAGQSERLTAGNRSFTYSALGLYSQTASGGYNAPANVPAAQLGPAAAAAARTKPAYSSPVQAALTHNQPGTTSAPLSAPAGTYTFTHDAQGTIISETTPSGKYYYSFSAIQLGMGPNPGALSVAAITDASGALGASYINCPSGNNIVQSGSAPNPLHTQSAYYDSSTGTQLYFGNGIYDSTIGRWGQNGYTFAWDLGSEGTLGSPYAAAYLFKSSPQDVFPFPLGGCQAISLGETCGLQPLSPLPVAAPVQVSSVSSAGFTFTALPHHFDPAGSTISFDVYASGGQDYLRQSAHWAPGGNPILEQLSAGYAFLSTWREQALNLQYLLLTNQVA